jgi:hypothetical protein
VSVLRLIKELARTVAACLLAILPAVDETERTAHLSPPPGLPAIRGTSRPTVTLA